MLNILENGSREYDYLKSINLEGANVENLLDQVNELFGYILTEKKSLEQKYDKLLELHNNLIEMNTAREEKYSAEYIYKLADENEILRNELNRVLSQKLELEKSQSVYNTNPSKIKENIDATPEKMHERIQILEKKLTDLELQKIGKVELKQKKTIEKSIGNRRKSKSSNNY